MNYKFLLLGCLSIFSYVALAQFQGDFHGYLLDDKGKALSNMLIDAPNGTTLKTDASGHFVVKLSEQTYQLPLNIHSQQYSLVVMKNYNSRSNTSLVVSGETLKKGVVKIFMTNKEIALGKNTQSTEAINPILTEDAVVATQSTKVSNYSGRGNIGGGYVSKKKKTLAANNEPFVETEIIKQEIPVVIPVAPKEEPIIVAKKVEPEPVKPEPAPVITTTVVQAPPQQIVQQYVPVQPQPVMYVAQQQGYYIQPQMVAQPVQYIQPQYMQPQPVMYSSQPIIQQAYPQQIIQQTYPQQQIIQQPVQQQPASVVMQQPVQQPIAPPTPIVAQKIETPVVEVVKEETPTITNNEDEVVAMEMTMPRSLEEPVLPEPILSTPPAKLSVEKVTLYEVQIACMVQSNTQYSQEYYENILQQKVNLRKKSDRMVYTVSAKDLEDARKMVAKWDNPKYDNLGIHDPFIITIEKETMLNNAQ